jgi:hypothetical protein
VLQGISQYERARRQLVLIRDSCDTKIVLVYHIAKYFGLPENEVISALK